MVNVKTADQENKQLDHALTSEPVIVQDTVVLPNVSKAKNDDQIVLRRSTRPRKLPSKFKDLEEHEHLDARFIFVILLG